MSLANHQDRRDAIRRFGSRLDALPHYYLNELAELVVSQRRHERRMKRAQRARAKERAKA